jgi:hypothetical protein
MLTHLWQTDFSPPKHFLFTPRRTIMKNRLPLRTLELLQVFTFKVEVVSVGWFVVCNATFNNISVVSWSFIGG